MPRYTRYPRLEKNIAASDTGGILERWTFGCRLLADGTASYPKSGNLKAGVLGRYIAEAKAAGFSLTEREIQYRIQCARAYPTEAEVRTACSQFAVWSDLRAAGFPQVEGIDPGDPYDPRDADEKQRDARAEIERRKAANPDQGALFDWSPPHQFRGDEHSPRSKLKELYAACEESERYTAGMAAYDAKRRAYVDECAAAVGEDLDKTWYEAEQRRKGLDALGLTDWDSLTEVMEDFFRLYDTDTADDGDGDDSADAEDLG